MNNHTNILKFVCLFGLAVLAIFSVSCGAQPPSITLFSVTPSEIRSGESSTLQWTVTDATSVTIDHDIGQVAANGSKQLSPSRTTAYTLTAANSGSTVTRAVVLYVAESPTAPPPPVVDNTPPVIKDISTSSETDTSVYITWTTNKAATSAVEYGKETAYGLNASSAELTTDHSLKLTGLEPNTAYHFKVSSSDKDGNKASSADDIFVTAQEKSPYSLALISEEWGRTSDSSEAILGAPPVASKKYLYINGTLQNKSQATLRAVIITMNCWSGSTIVKYEIYVYRGPALPGQVFSYNVQTADDPTVDNVTADYADSLGREIVVTKAQ